MVHLTRNFDVLHDMRGNTTKGCFGKVISVSLTKEITLPPNKLIISVVNEELEVTFDRSFLEYWEFKVFSKSSIGFNVENI